MEKPITLQRGNYKIKIWWSPAKEFLYEDIDILAAIASLGYDYNSIQSQLRNHHATCVKERYTLWYLLHTRCKFSIRNIAHYFNRTLSGVRYGIKKHINPHYRERHKEYAS